MLRRAQQAVIRSPNQRPGSPGPGLWSPLETMPWTVTLRESGCARRGTPATGPSRRRYAAYYLTRNSLSYTAPEMIKDPALNFDMTKVGGLVSIMPVAYACSKFISGVIGARTSPVLLLAGALLPFWLPATPNTASPKM